MTKKNFQLPAQEKQNAGNKELHFRAVKPHSLHLILPQN